MPTTPRLEIPTPAATDPPDIPVDMQEMATAIDVLSPSLVGTFAARPAASATLAGRLYYATDQDVLYVDEGGTWGRVDPATNSVTDAKISNGAVLNTKLANDAVSTVKILDTAVTNPKLAADAVSTVKIADGAVTTPKVADNNVTAAKLESNAKPATLLGRWDTIAETGGFATAAVVVAAGDWLFTPSGITPFGGGSTAQVGIAFNAADYAVAGLQARMRIRGSFSVNAVSPGAANVFVKMYTIASTGGGAGVITYASGGSVAASETQAVMVAGNAILLAGAEFAAPATAVYGLGFSSSAAWAANSAVAFRIRVEIRHIV